MRYDPKEHHRHSMRLKGYDYGQPGGYFVTLCTRNRECLFGEVIDGKMVLNYYGQIVKDEWLRSSQIRREIVLDEFIIMPNHIHGIVIIVGATGRSPLQKSLAGPMKKSLGSFIAGFKSAVTSHIIEISAGSHRTIWQRNYYEHIIRDETDLNQIREYIENNPAKWLEDENHPENIEKTVGAVREPPLQNYSL